MPEVTHLGNRIDKERSHPIETKNKAFLQTLILNNLIEFRAYLMLLNY